MNSSTVNLVKRYAMATVGMFIVAMGIALSIKSNLGTSPLSCPPYVLHLECPAMSVGLLTWIVNTLYIIIQVAILRKRFKARYLLQIVASAVFGFLIDLSMLMIVWINVSSIVWRIVLVLVSCAITALGVSMESKADAWMLSAEMTVFALVETKGLDFGRTKVWMDCIVVILSSLLAIVFFGNPFGGGEYTGFADILLARTSGVVIGLGTLVLALLTGWMMKFTDPIVDKLYAKTGVTG